MKIHSVSKFLSFPFVLMCLAILYYSAVADRDASVYVLLPVFFLVVLYVFHGVIDHWWLSKFPLTFDPKLKEWLIKYFPFYTNLDDVQKTKFEYRLGLYLNGRLFASIGKEQREVPEDVKCMVAAHGVAIHLNQEDYLIQDIDRIYLYKHPFPTPLLHALHSVETNMEDGVIILSMEQVSYAILKPEEYYNVAYHAYAEIFVHIYPNLGYPDCQNTWSEIEAMTCWTKSALLQQTGLTLLDQLVVHIVLYFSLPVKYKTSFPYQYERFSHIFPSR